LLADRNPNSRTLRQALEIIKPSCLKSKSMRLLSVKPLVDDAAHWPTRL
jgi:hypothetical protein